MPDKKMNVRKEVTASLKNLQSLYSRVLESTDLDTDERNSAKAEFKDLLDTVADRFRKE